MEGEELGLIEDEGGTELEESGGEGGEEEITEGEEGGGGEESEEGAEEISEGEEGDRGPAATRTLPTELRKALREFNAGNPDFARRYPRLERQLTAALYKAGQADKFGGLPQLRSAVQLIESHGGAEKIAQMAEEVESGRVLQEGMQQGDPVLIDIWSREHPNGFKAMVGPSILKLEQMDLPAHDRALADPIYRTLDRCQVIDTVNQLETAIAGEDFDAIKKEFGSLKNFLVELKNFGARSKTPDPLKADRDRLEAEVQTERQRTFYGGVRTEVGTSTTAWINRALRQELAGKKLQVGTANRLRKQINEDLAAAVNTAPGYAERYKAIMKTGDHQRAVQFIVQNARQKIPLIVKRVLRDFNLGARPGPRGTARRPAGGSGRLVGTGSAVIAGRPKTSEVDFTRTDKARYLSSLGGHGEAFLRNGKLAKW